MEGHAQLREGAAGRRTAVGARHGPIEEAAILSERAVVDAHVHVWSAECPRYPRQAGARAYPPERFTAEEYLAVATAAGVGRAVLVQMNFYGPDHGYLFDCLRDHPGRFAAVGLVDPVAGADSAVDALAAAGVRGLRISGDDQPGDWLSRPGVTAVFRSAARHNLVVCPLVDPGDLPGIEQLCAAHPDVLVVIDHLGRIGMNGTIRDDDLRRLCGLARLPNVFVKLSAFYALGRRLSPYDDLATVIRPVFDAFGPRRLMWGSDCPFQEQAGHGLRESVGLVRHRLPFLQDDDREWLLAGTANAVFFDPRRALSLATD